MRFCCRSAPEGDVNLRILSKRDPLHLFEAECGTRHLSLVLAADQGTQAF
jgi:hypothetical protein